MSEDDFPLEPRRAHDRATQDQAMYGPAVAAQLATLNATVAALHGELYRSMNGVEKTMETGFDGVGKRLDKLEDRMGSAETRDAAVEARVQALEEAARNALRVDEESRRVLQADRNALAQASVRFTVWQILAAAVIALIGVAGTLAGLGAFG